MILHEMQPQLQIGPVNLYRDILKWLWKAWEKGILSEEHLGMHLVVTFTFKNTYAEVKFMSTYGQQLTVWPDGQRK